MWNEGGPLAATGAGCKRGRQHRPPPPLTQGLAAMFGVTTMVRACTMTSALTLSATAAIARRRSLRAMLRALPSFVMATGHARMVRHSTSRATSRRPFYGGLALPLCMPSMPSMPGMGVRCGCNRCSRCSLPPMRNRCMRRRSGPGKGGHGRCDGRCDGQGHRGQNQFHDSYSTKN